MPSDSLLSNKITNKKLKFANEPTNLFRKNSIFRGLSHSLDCVVILTIK